jgi:uncharacterized damage-inducible protein DinB
MNKDAVGLMARYNQWMNETTYALCALIPDDQRKMNRGAYFRSIHGTLNHLLHVDLLWMGCFVGRELTNAVIGEDIFNDFDDLRVNREALDARIIRWSKGVTPEWLAAPLTYICAVDGRLRTLPAWVLVMQMSNHQTHHRGQLTTLLNQIGFDHGVTNLPSMPEFEMCVSTC